MDRGICSECKDFIKSGYNCKWCKSEDKCLDSGYQTCSNTNCTIKITQVKFIYMYVSMPAICNLVFKRTMLSVHVHIVSVYGLCLRSKVSQIVILTVNQYKEICMISYMYCVLVVIYVQRSDIKITSGSNKETGHICTNCTDIEV